MNTVRGEITGRAVAAPVEAAESTILAVAEALPLVVTIAEAMLLTRKGRSSIYEAITRGELEAVKDGSRTFITTESIRRRTAALPRVGRDVPMTVPAGLRASASKSGT
jgi:hypothetical protein